MRSKTFQRSSTSSSKFDMTIVVPENKSQTVQTGGKLSTSSSNSSITVVENETEKIEELSSSKTSYVAEGKID